MLGSVIEPVAGLGGVSGAGTGGLRWGTAFASTSDALCEGGTGVRLWRYFRNMVKRYQIRPKPIIPAKTQRPVIQPVLVALALGRCVSVHEEVDVGAWVETSV